MLSIISCLGNGVLSYHRKITETGAGARERVLLIWPCDLLVWPCDSLEECGRFGTLDWESSWTLWVGLSLASGIKFSLAAFPLIWFDFHSPISVFSRAEVFILTEPSVFFIAHILNIPSENTSLKPRPHRFPGLPFYLLPYVYGPFELIFT